MSQGLRSDYAPPLDVPFRFMGLGVAWLALVGLLYPWHLPLLLSSFYAPHALAFVHANTLGVIAPVVMGAGYQLLPVVLETPLAWIRLARSSFWLLLAGQFTFVAGLGGGPSWLIPVGGILCFGALGHYLAVVVGTLYRTVRRDAIFWHLAAGALALGTAITLGAVMAVSKVTGFLGARTLPALAAHATLMTAGWLMPTVTGIGYRLVGMFALSEHAFRPAAARWELALGVAGTWSLAVGLFLGWSTGPLVMAALLIVASLVVFLLHVGRMYRQRRRRAIDVHMPYALFAFGCGLLSALLRAVGLAGRRPMGDAVYVTALWLVLAGWAESAIQGFLYKIGSFLIWLHRYAPTLGTVKAPRLEDMYHRRTALVGAGCWAAGVTLAALGALLQSEAAVTGAAPLLMAGVGCFAYNAVRLGRHWAARPAGAEAVTAG